MRPLAGAGWRDRKTLTDGRGRVERTVTPPNRFFLHKIRCTIPLIACCLQEVRMPARLACLLLVLIVLPALSQQTTTPANIQSRIEKKIDWHNEMAEGTVPPAETDAAAARRQTIHQDAEALSALSVSLYPDLQQLRKGLLAKDLDEKLKKMEKLSKKLHRDLQP